MSVRLTLPTPGVVQTTPSHDTALIHLANFPRRSTPESCGMDAINGTSAPTRREIESATLGRRDGERP